MGEMVDSRWEHGLSLLAQVWLYSLLSVWPWADYFTFLCSSSLSRVVFLRERTLR